MSDGLACVVLSHGNEPGLVDAVRSLLEQDPAPDELVVVNQGGGGARATLAAAGLGRVATIDRSESGFAGRARNLGIRATTARYVAFLAADCLAEPGWVAGRLHHHRVHGRPVVATAVTTAPPRTAAADAAQLLTYWTRTSDTPPEYRALYGCSYDRAIFAHFGLFREDLRSHEDVELFDRIIEGVPFGWAPEARTAHRNPATVGALLRDAFRRGRLTVASEGALGRGDTRREVARRAFRDAVGGLRATRWARGAERRRYARAVPLLLPAALAHAAGALTAGRTGTGPAREARRRRLIAVVPVRDEMRFLPGLLANLAPHVDGIVALDDGSTDGTPGFLSHRPEVLEVLHSARPEGGDWDEPEGHRRLAEAARRHGADWILSVDADERVEEDFRAHAEAEIDRAEREGVDGWFVHIRELWDRPDRMRVDGWFGKKKRATLFRAREDHVHDPRPLHAHRAPMNDHPDGLFPQADLIVYHLRMLHRSDREARQARYEALDPDNEHQSFGYGYMTDETGIELAPLPAGRGFTPAETPPELLLPSSPGGIMPACPPPALAAAPGPASPRPPSRPGPARS